MSFLTFLEYFIFEIQNGNNDLYIEYHDKHVINCSNFELIKPNFGHRRMT